MKNRFSRTIIALLLIVSAGTGIAQAQERTGANEGVLADASLLPLPVSRVMSEGFFRIENNTAVLADGNTDQILARYLNDYIKSSLVPPAGYDSGRSYARRIILSESQQAGKKPEGYRITVTGDEVKIEGYDRAGVFYGVQTFLQLLPVSVYNKGAGDAYPLYDSVLVPCQVIEDYPAFAYRGMMLDVARTFSGIDRVKRFIDHMSHHKLNKFHWHLTDDEGWRIEIKSYPKLAEVGGFRGGDSPVWPIYGAWDRKYGGYFTQEQIREVVGYAALRSIEVIPEVELPGHSRTAALVYPQILCAGPPHSSAAGYDRRNVWCAAKEGNYQMLDKIIGEMAALFPSEYIHVGGDEVATGQWKACPDCQRLMREKGMTNPKQLTDHFIGRLHVIAAKYGKKIGVWDEAAESGKLDKTSYVYGWQGVKQNLAVTEMGYPTIVMPGPYFYFDHKQSPTEEGLTWAGLVDIKKTYSFDFRTLGFDSRRMNSVLGVEGAFFSELYVSHDEPYLDYQTYPRICALAEVGWTDGQARRWDDFYGRLTGGHLDRLTAMGIEYRQFPAQVDYEGGNIVLEPPFSGAEIYFTNDGSEPNLFSHRYVRPIADTMPQKYLFRSYANGCFGPSISPTAKSHIKLAAGTSQTVRIPLSDIITTNGIWYLRMRTAESNLKFSKLAITTDGRTANIIAGQQNVSQFHRIRVHINDNNRNGVLSATVQNLNRFPCELTFELEPSPYIEPKVRVTGSLTAQSRFPMSNLEDYNHTSYVRTTMTCKKGDNFTFTFTEPVDAYSIDVHTGLSYLPRYHIPMGRVQLSTDGVNFTDAANLVEGKAVVFPAGKIKALRIISDSNGNGEGAVALQDLRIKPRYK